MGDFKAQLSDANPAAGLRLEFAMGWYGDQAIAQGRGMPLHLAQAAVSYTLKHGLQPGDPSYIDPNCLPEMRRKAAVDRGLLLTDIAAQLRSGKLYAVGLRIGEYQPVAIPREWWGVATLNPELNMAEGNGVTFSGLLIFEAAVPDATTTKNTEPPQIDTGRADQSHAEAVQWMAENVTHPGQWKRALAIAACAKQPGVTHRQAISAWDALGKHLKRTRGFRK